MYPDEGRNLRVSEPLHPYGEQPAYDIAERCRQFALWVIGFTRKLREQGWVALSEQLFDSGTSIGAQLSEAQQAESRKDFLHKIRIAAKEAKETKYWLSLCRDSPHLPYDEGSWQECDAINAILGTIIKRTIVNDPKRKKP